MFGETEPLGGEALDTHAVALNACTIWIVPREAAQEISPLIA